MSSVNFVDNSDKFLAELSQRIDKALTAVGIQIEGEAKEELNGTTGNPKRIDTGLLRNSLTYALSGESPAISSYRGDNSSKYSKVESIPVGYYNGTAPSDPDDQRAVYVGTNVEYAAYVHEGTQKMAPNRFLKNAVTRNEEQIRKYIERELKG